MTCIFQLKKPRKTTFLCKRIIQALPLLKGCIHVEIYTTELTDHWAFFNSLFAKLIDCYRI
jgi:hypothetical protein